MTNTKTKSAIIIPARFDSKRFPGKPLAMIAGRTMLQRVVAIAKKAQTAFPETEIYVATDDVRIAEHAKTIGITALMTPATCQTGSDRIIAACKQLTTKLDVLINLQGDAPLTPPSIISAMLKELIANSSVQIVTPVYQLSWEKLDELREHKKSTPFSGTTAIIDKNRDALWFSKNIIPALRNEKTLRQESELSPIYKQLGLYGYRYDTLLKFTQLPAGHYETLEGLEQLRFLENGFKIRAVEIPGALLSVVTGIDSPEDVKRAETFILEHGELDA